MATFQVIKMLIIAFLLALVAFAIGELTKGSKALPEESGRAMASPDRPRTRKDDKG